MGFNANVIKMDKYGNVKNYTFILATKNYNHLGQLNNVKLDTIHNAGNLASSNEISFEVYRKLDSEIESLWDDIVNGKTLFIPELEEYFQITVSYDDKLDEIKTVTCTSLCEAELSQINIDGTEINTETDIERTDYVQTTFYNPDNPKASLLDRILSKAPNYKIGYVDTSLWNIQRTFSIDGTPIYDFLTGECSEQFNCLFTFDSRTRTVNAFDMYSVCNSCGYRGAYHDKCPECNSTDIQYFGEDTVIYVDKENLTDSIKLEVTETKNCFKLVAGDDEMTALIRSLNPNGSGYIIHINDSDKKDMSSELVEKLDSYDELYNSRIDSYQELVVQYNDVMSEIDYYTHTMMPKPEDEETGDEIISISEQEIKKLSTSVLSPLGLSSITASTSLSTADSAVINYARVFVNTSLVKVDVQSSTFTYIGKDADGWDYGTWTGILKLTAYSDSEDTSYTDEMSITIHDNYGDYIKQKAIKDISLVDKEGSIYDVLAIDDLTEFKSALELYCLNRLTSFRTAIETGMTTLMGVDQAREGADWYEELYVPYYNKLQACEAEIDKREATIATLTTQAETINSQKLAIQKELDFETYLGNDLYLEFCAYRREQEYNNSNYICDGLTDSEKIERARDFLESAKKELLKASMGQHNISTTLYNLMLMEEFKPIVNKFALGNFIRIKVGKDIYRLRLIGYDINFSDLSTIGVTFSDATKLNDTSDHIKEVLSSAQSMASTYSYVQNQAHKGEKADMTINEMIQNSLEAATMKITNNVHEDVSVDNSGVICRAKDDVSGLYSPKQLRLTHNVMMYTKNNWLSSEMGIGEMTYELDGETYKDYGIITHYLIAGKVISGDIYSANYSSSGAGTHINLNDGSFTFGDGTLTYDKTNGLKVKGNIEATDGIFNGIIYTKEGGTIGGIDIGENFLKADVLASDGYLRRTYIQGAYESTPENTWIFSVQKAQKKGSNDGDVFDGLWVVTGDGDMIVQNVTIKGNIIASGDNLSIGSTGSINSKGSLYVKDYISTNGYLSVEQNITTNSIITAKSYIETDNVVKVKGTGTNVCSYFSGKVSIGTSNYDTSYILYTNGASYFNGAITSSSYIKSSNYMACVGSLEILTGGGVSNVILHNNYDRKAYIRIDDSEYLWLVPHTSSGFDSANSAHLDLTTGIMYSNGWANNSSLKYKENITDMENEIADRLLNIPIHHFDYKEEYGKKDIYGVIAEEVYEIHPNVVALKDGEPDAVDYTKFIPLLIKKIQMQQEEINSLKDTIEE